jgi:hypothetical protein
MAWFSNCSLQAPSRRRHDGDVREIVLAMALLNQEQATLPGQNTYRFSPPCP